MLEAAFNGELSKVQALVGEAGDLTRQVALFNAAKKGHAHVVEFLVTNGVDIDTQVKGEWTCLTTACYYKYWAVAKALIANGADVNLATDTGYTALISAAEAGELDMVEALIAKGANVNARTVMGITALQVASTQGHKDVVGTLTRAGAVAGANIAATLEKAITLINEGQPIDAVERLLALEAGGDDEQLQVLKKAVSMTLANYAVDNSNKVLPRLDAEISRNAWDSGYNLAEAQSRRTALKYRTITWLKMASALDPSNLQLSGLIDSYSQMHGL